MRITFEVDNDSQTDITSTDVVDEHSVGSWKHLLATAVLVGSIVVAPISNWLDSLVVVQQVRSVVYPQFEQPVNNSLASRVYQAMRRKGYKVFTNEGEVNIIYLRGAEFDGKSNGNAINEWSDRRLVLMFRNGQPTIAGNWAATVKPGLPAIRNPLGKAGAAFIEPGQYKAWRVDIHNGIFGRSEEGLVQVAPVNFRRDVNRNGKVDSEPIQSGIIGLNQHSGSDQLKVDRASYACLAAQSQSGHLYKFMPLVKADPRYRRNRAFVFTTTILDARDL
ncbi:hypothetical protein DSM106972_052710 [Dulcicalothrix desertica PCC 7102]|uniref:Uncharacterized protein n=1 Tax=Dulcicalothrix desertica PCC 7102 TaxID=232991 RepID=A0A3S1CB49_9CYAN|nr:hypothetical protein [Dulcicalothrix desertica]RUT03632.1 hypothetical protein DSM106972_052710 [Dulcicalothrix desertica PCC 7102]TWH43928.1 hypothetical protein CAL7102_07680 [Dulcicalothrix desertica PCC 7102]